MPVLHYYSASGELTIFPNYDIGENGVITNVKTGQVISRRKNSGYNIVNVRNNEGTQRTIRVSRAIASTFLGKPPTEHHTAEHDDRNRNNDTLKNIRWEGKSGQSFNQHKPSTNKSAFVIARDDVEHTAKEWVEIFKKPSGEKYTDNAINNYAQRQQHGFKYKKFPNLRGEVWKPVPGAKNTKGEWLISNKNRMKYKTKHAENVLTVDQLSKDDGYPIISIKGKHWSCHDLSFMTFRPNEYAARLPGDMILHKNDDREDFNPFRLRWGTPPDNGVDAHRNGKYDGTKSAQKPVASYINGILEKEHISNRAAESYLRNNGYTTADRSGIRYALRTGSVSYGRTWVYIDVGAIK
ncbi:hypothetical protein ATCVBr0604L_539L [Acanthocystis turfacea Chlorella virus Br0604L]|nr:hypothetical protein ATCVBr0604L_539L [Acanthocystis turfacea Chlorella virus Br0604L]